MHMQLHECRGASDSGHSPVRACGMEANCEPELRTKVNSHRGIPVWVNVLRTVTPYFQSWQASSESGCGGKSWSLTPRELLRSIKW